MGHSPSGKPLPISQRTLSPAPVDLPAESPRLTDEQRVADGVRVDGEALREAMRLLASPVVVVTAEADGEPRGATIGSFTSVSLEPPLVSFNVTRDTRLHHILLRAEHFAVHVLAEDQAEMATHFARPDLDGFEQLASVPHSRGESRPPLIEGMLGVLVCRPESRFAAGDHSLFVGSVVEVLPGRDGAPLVYHKGRYRGVGEPTAGQ